MPPGEATHYVEDRSKSPRCKWHRERYEEFAKNRRYVRGKSPAAADALTYRPRARPAEVTGIHISPEDLAKARTRTGRLATAAGAASAALAAATPEQRKTPPHPELAKLAAAAQDLADLLTPLIYADD